MANHVYTITNVTNTPLQIARSTTQQRIEYTLQAGESIAVAMDDVLANKLTSYGNNLKIEKSEKYTTQDEISSPLVLGAHILNKNNPHDVDATQVSFQSTGVQLAGKSTLNDALNYVGQQLDDFIANSSVSQDHSSLTNLDADDHKQYLTEERHAAITDESKLHNPKKHKHDLKNDAEGQALSIDYGGTGYSGPYTSNNILVYSNGKFKSSDVNIDDLILSSDIDKVLPVSKGGTSNDNTGSTSFVNGRFLTYDSGAKRIISSPYDIENIGKDHTHSGTQITRDAVSVKHGGTGVSFTDNTNNPYKENEYLVYYVDENGVGKFKSAGVGPDTPSSNEHRHDLSNNSQIYGVLPLAKGGTNNNNSDYAYETNKFIKFDGTRFVTAELPSSTSDGYFGTTGILPISRGGTYNDGSKGSFESGKYLYLKGDHFETAPYGPDDDITDHNHTMNQLSGILPISKGGTSTDGSSWVKDGIIYYDGNKLATISGSKYSDLTDHEHSANNITSGILPIDHGGTNTNLAELSLANNKLIKYSSSKQAFISSGYSIADNISNNEILTIINNTIVGTGKRWDESDKVDISDLVNGPLPVDKGGTYNDSFDPDTLLYYYSPEMQVRSTPFKYTDLVTKSDLSNIDLSKASGILPIANGGTNNNYFKDNQLVISKGTSYSNTQKLESITADDVISLLNLDSRYPKLINGLVPPSQLPAGIREIRVVNNIAQRDAITDSFSGLTVFVLEDTSVTDNKWSQWIWANSQWIKLTDFDDGGFVITELDWAVLKNIPTPLKDYIDGHVIDHHHGSDGISKVEWNEVNHPDQFVPTVHGHTSDNDGGLIEYSSINNKPTEFTPSAHDHTADGNMGIVEWGAIKDTPTSFPAEPHNHTVESGMGRISWKVIDDIPAELSSGIGPHDHDINNLNSSDPDYVLNTAHGGLGINARTYYQNGQVPVYNSYTEIFEPTNVSNIPHTHKLDDLVKGDTVEYLPVTLGGTGNNGFPAGAIITADVQTGTTLTGHQSDNSTMPTKFASNLGNNEYLVYNKTTGEIEPSGMTVGSSSKAHLPDSTGILPVEKGGTGKNLKDDFELDPSKNNDTLIRYHYDENTNKHYFQLSKDKYLPYDPTMFGSVDDNYYVFYDAALGLLKPGVLKQEGFNFTELYNHPKGDYLQGVLPIEHGGTNSKLSDFKIDNTYVIYKDGKLQSSDTVVGSLDTLSADKLIGIIPVSKGGTGVNGVSDSEVKFIPGQFLTYDNTTEGSERITSSGYTYANFAPSGHTHTLSEFSDGILPVNRGGTGVDATKDLLDKHIIAYDSSSEKFYTIGVTINDLAKSNHTHKLDELDLSNNASLFKNDTILTVNDNKIISSNFKVPTAGSGGIAIINSDSITDSSVKIGALNDEEIVVYKDGKFTTTGKKIGEIASAGPTNLDDDSEVTGLLKVKNGGTYNKDYYNNEILKYNSSTTKIESAGYEFNIDLSKTYDNDIITVTKSSDLSDASSRNIVQSTGVKLDVSSLIPSNSGNFLVFKDGKITTSDVNILAFEDTGKIDLSDPAKFENVLPVVFGGTGNDFVGIDDNYLMTIETSGSVRSFQPAIKLDKSKLTDGKVLTYNSSTDSIESSAAGIDVITDYKSFDPNLREYKLICFDGDNLIRSDQSLDDIYKADINLQEERIKGILPTKHGGTGVDSTEESSYVNAGESSLVYYVKSEDKFLVSDKSISDIKSVIDLSSGDVTNVLPIVHGGTGSSGFITPGNLVEVSSDGKSLISSSESVQSIIDKVSGSSTVDLSPTDEERLKGILSVKHGGTGVDGTSEFTINKILYYDGSTIASTDYTIDELKSFITTSINIYPIDLSEANNFNNYLPIAQGGTNTSSFGTETKIIEYDSTTQSLRASTKSVDEILSAMESDVDLSNDVTSILPLANGGTNNAITDAEDHKKAIMIISDDGSRIEPSNITIDSLITSVDLTDSSTTGTLPLDKGGTNNSITDGEDHKDAIMIMSSDGTRIEPSNITISSLTDPTNLDSDTMGTLPLDKGGTGYSITSSIANNHKNELMILSDDGSRIEPSGVTLESLSPDINLASNKVDGILPIEHGGTGVDSLEPDAFIKSNSAGNGIVFDTTSYLPTTGGTVSGELTVQNPVNEGNPVTLEYFNNNRSGINEKCSYKFNYEVSGSENKLASIKKSGSENISVSFTYSDDKITEVSLFNEDNSFNRVIYKIDYSGDDSVDIITKNPDSSTESN